MSSATPDATLNEVSAISGRRMALTKLRREIRKHANPQRADVNRRYFKTGRGEYGEGDRFVGLSAPIARRLAREFEGLSLADLSALLRSRWHEERVIALLILVRRYARAPDAERARLHRFYLRHLSRVDSWDLVDCSAPPLVGAHLRGPQRALLTRLAKSPRVWDRRIAIVATQHYIRQGEFEPTLAMTVLLLDDRHDLIHKAAGWMLREVAKRDRAVAERFLREHAARMPRTMLRYAIERFPPALRARYLSVAPRRRAEARRDRRG